MQNRIIKFRAWQTTHETFIPLEDDGDYFFIDQGDGLELHNKYGRCKNIVLLQFTGLKDKNGKDIYEGDVVIDIAGRKLSVEWNDDTCKVQFSDGSDINDGERYGTYKAIVGNIYENPEPLTNPMANK